MAEFYFWERIDWAGRLMLAQAVIVGFLLLNVVSFSLPHAGDFKPFFLLMAIYYWAIYRPTILPSPYTFLLGIVMDLQGSLPIGLSALVFVLIQSIVRRQRLFLMGQPFVMVWIGFALTAFANAAILWGALSLFSMHAMPFMPTLVAAFFSVLIFPLAALVLLGVHKLLPVASKPLHSVG